MDTPERIVVCLHCNVVLFRDGKLVEERPSTICSHLRGGAYVRASDDQHGAGQGGTQGP